MKGFLVKIALVINGIFVFLLLLSYGSVLVRPGALGLFAFIGMGYPFFLLANLCFVLFWVVFRKWYLIISFLFVLLGWSFIGRYIQLPQKRDHPAYSGESFKVLTYNVRLFNYYLWNEDTAARSNMLNFVLEENPDVVCFQEFVSIPGTGSDLANLKQQLPGLPYVQVYYTNTVPGKLQFGMATFSKYPIVEKGIVDFEPSLNGSIYSDILYNKDTIRIYNCHLQSIRLRNNYNNLLDSLVFHYNEKQLAEIKEISTRMRQAFIQRAQQTDALSAHIQSSPHAVIICGDFNDTPVSYTYQELTRHMKDAFVESGSGFGTTYRGFFPYMRIDYVLYDPVFHVSRLSSEKSDWSDHYPVVVEFAIDP